MTAATTTTQTVTRPRHVSTSKRSATLSVRVTADNDATAYPRPPLQPTGALAESTHRRINPVLGERFDTLQLKDILDSPAAERDAVLRDLAILIARRGVVVFKKQDTLPPEVLGDLVHRLGQLSGKPASSHLHIHPLNGNLFNEDGSRKGGEKITNERDEKGAQISFQDERSDFASAGWHTDISFEPVPADFTVLRMSKIPESGGDTLFASAYEAYDRLSDSMKMFLEGLTATHDADIFKQQARRYNFELRTLARGCPEDSGDAMQAVHPVIRTNPVTGYKAINVNKTFTVRINELKKDESDILLNYLFRLIADNHNLQLRHTWDENDTVIWDNRSVLHTATWDFDNAPRAGDRAVSLAERPYLDPKSRSRREAIAAGERA